MFIFSLCVSGDYVTIIRRNNCVYVTLGTCYSAWMTVWYEGAYAPAYQAVCRVCFMHISISSMVSRRGLFCKFVLYNLEWHFSFGIYDWQMKEKVKRDSLKCIQKPGMESLSIKWNSKKLKQSHYRPEVPRGFQEVKVPRLRDNGPGWW